MAYEDVFSKEIMTLQEIMSLAERIASKVEEGASRTIKRKIEKPLMSNEKEYGEA